MPTQPSPIPTREALVLVLRAHPEWTLAQLTMLAPKLLGRVRVGDLWASDSKRRVRAESLRGAEFDACVLAVIREAKIVVAASYLRDRVGGPRWKLQASLGRLTEAHQIVRTGTTGTTRYEFAVRSN